MNFIFIAGKGRVFVPGVRPVTVYDPVTNAPRETGEEELVHEVVESDEITVSPFGVVSYLVDGARHVGYNLQVEITEAEELPLAPPQAQGGVDCERCGGNLEMIRTWVPPVCPRCGRR